MPDLKTQPEIDKMIEEIVRGMVNLSRRKVGVLIVVEHKTALPTSSKRAPCWTA